MEDMSFPKRRSRRASKAQDITIEHYYHVELFYVVDI